MNKLRRRAAYIALASVVLGGIATAVLAGWSYRELRRPYSGWGGEFVDVDLSPGLSARRVLSRLTEAGVVRRPGLLRAWLSLNGEADSLHAGEYRFSEPISPLGILERLERGDVLLHPVTVPEGLDLQEVAERIEAQGFGPGQALLAAFRDPAAIRELDTEAADLEGYLFPETYHFPRSASAETIASALVQRFRETVGEDYPARATAAGLTLRQAVTLASLIERETAVPEERGRISRVFHNRLKRGMRLECDPTVLYALKVSGQAVSRLTFRDLEFDSPWNTYVVHGLPRGPIASPGRASLEAAVEPDDGEELYFVAAPEGGHRFSSTYEAHQRAVAAWRAHARSSR